MNIILSDPSISMADFTESQAIKSAARDESIMYRDFGKESLGIKMHPSVALYYEYKNIAKYDEMNAKVKAVEINSISQNIAINLFGEDYKKNFGRVRDKEVIYEILTESLKDIDYRKLKEHEALLKEKFTPKIKELTEPTFIGNTLKSIGQDNNRIQIKSITKEDRAKITKELKELFSNELNKIQEEKKRMSAVPLSPTATPKKKTIMRFFGRN